jgi:hypothetical protein
MLCFVLLLSVNPHAPAASSQKRTGRVVFSMPVTEETAGLCHSTLFRQNFSNV